MALNLSTLIKQLQASMSKANVANLQRYQAGLTDISAGYGAAMGQAQKFGTTALQDIETSTARQRATSEQSLISRGLGSTTIRGAMTRGIEADKLRARARVGEQKAGLLGGLAERQAGALSGYRARMSDVGPDMGLFAGLIAAAQAGTGTTALPGTTARTSPGLGTMASRGLDIFGQPMGRYSDGGGGAGGGIGSLSTGSGTGGGVTAGRPGTVTYGAGGGTSAPGGSFEGFPALQQAAAQETPEAGDPPGLMSRLLGGAAGATGGGLMGLLGGGGLGGMVGAVKGAVSGGKAGTRALEGEFNRLSRQYAKRFGKASGLSHSAANLGSNVQRLRQMLAG